MNKWVFVFFFHSWLTVNFLSWCFRWKSHFFSKCFWLKSLIIFEGWCTVLIISASDSQAYTFQPKNTEKEKKRKWANNSQFRRWKCEKWGWTMYQLLKINKIQQQLHIILCQSWYIKSEHKVTLIYGDFAPRWTQCAQSSVK